MKEQPKSYISKDGHKIWYLPSKGKTHYHRVDGPALEYKHGSKEWWVNDKLHRIDGPAIEYRDGSKWWYVDGKHISPEEVEAWLEENDVDLKTEEGQMAFKLRWL